MQSKASTVEQYLAELPEDRRAAIQAVRKVIRKAVDKNIEEVMQYGMIGYVIPHRVYPAGYHCKPSDPLPYACLASQKGYMSLYMMGVYGPNDDASDFAAAWKKTGKKLDMGKSCIRFKKVEDLALDVIADFIRRCPSAEYIRRYEAILNEPKAVRAEWRKKQAAPKPTKAKAKARA
jgi:hypothetical protein